MGNTIISQPKHLLTQAGGIAFPWTAPSDGFLLCYLSASGASNSYGQIRNESLGYNMRLSAHNGYSTSGAYPVAKGNYVTFSGAGSGDNFYVYFMPIAP